MTYQSLHHRSVRLAAKERAPRQERDRTHDPERRRPRITKAARECVIELSYQQGQCLFKPLGCRRLRFFEKTLYRSQWVCVSTIELLKVLGLIEWKTDLHPTRRYELTPKGMRYARFLG